MSRYPPCPVPREGLQLRSFTLRSAGPPEAVWPGKSGVPSLSVVRRASCRGGRWVPAPICGTWQLGYLKLSI